MPLRCGSMQLKRHWFKLGARIQAVAQPASQLFFSCRARAAGAGDLARADKRPALARSAEIEPLLMSTAEAVMALVDPCVLASHHAAVEPVAGGRPLTLAAIRASSSARTRPTKPGR